MCGIAGILHPDTERYAPIVQGMISTLAHRGPDDEGIWIDDNVVLGHRRLSIIDLSDTGHQPMGTPSGRSWVIQNGEIYNYKELRQDLAAKGHQFAGTSDTEVIPHLYEDDPANFVSTLRGMFAFALWDAQQKILVLARDRAGKKPLFYAPIPGGYAFASEIKALHQVPEIDNRVRSQGVHDYLSFGIVPGPETIYQGIRRVSPAHVLRLTADGSSEVRRYWSLRFDQKQNWSTQDAIEQIDSQLREAVKLRLRSDVPVGCFLSGGIDSGLVTAMAAEELGQPLKTYCVGFDVGAYDERPLARQVADRYHTDHHDTVLTSMGEDRIDKIIGHYDEPFADQSALPSYLVSEIAGRDIKVVLNGDGSDEIFAGYRHYVAFALQRRLDSWGALPKSLSQTALRLLPQPTGNRSPYQFAHRFLRVLAAPETERYMVLTKDLLSEAEKSNFYGAASATSLEESVRLLDQLRHSYGTLDAVDQMSGYNFERLLSDTLLIKMDIASMAHSLEARSPFLDHKMIELAAQIPASVKLPGRRTKPLLRQLAEKYLPTDIVHAPKRGFELPLQKWMTGSLNDTLTERLTDKASFAQSHFDQSAVDAFLTARGWDLKRWASVAWMMLCLEIWWSRQGALTTR